MSRALFSLSGKVALLTGATGGLGTAIAWALADQGATVLLSDRDAAACHGLEHALRAAGHQAHALPCDLLDPDAPGTLADLALALRGHIDILICNAGIQGPAGPSTGVLPAQWDLVMDLNLRSAHLLCQQLLPAMAQRGGGSVILMSSIAGIRGNKHIGLYGLSKAALSQLARNLAVEWGPSNVRVNAIAPGLIATPLATPLLENASFMERRLAQTPLRRVGEPHEVAGVVVMLASAAGAFVCGQTLVVDGGTTISDGN